MKKKSICGMSADDFIMSMGSDGFAEKHSLSVINAVYKKSLADFSKLGNIPVRLKDFLEKNYSAGIYPPKGCETSADGTKKYLFRNDEDQYFETVFIPEGKRNTVCVSTQSGCRMGCPFCITGKYGFYGNLDSGDIVNQVAGIPEAAEITHVVFMGMGEPLDNIENVLKACNIFTAEWGKSLSPRNITLSTVGIIKGVKQFLESSQANLALSLFSPFTEERKKMVPAEAKNPVMEIVAIMKNFPVRKKRRLSLAYVMIDGVNDTDKHLKGLTELTEGTGIRINLLPYHRHENDSLNSSPAERMMFFKHNLVLSGISASIRKSRGADISAACGLLASGMNKKRL